MAIAGHISDASAMGGIAIGGMLFDLLYWNFGFLRVGTGGMTAQAFGRKDRQGMIDILSQSISLALGGALLVWAISWLFVDIVMGCVPCSPVVESFAREYFWIRIWAAPATLSLMALKGWFIGTQNTVNPMICDITVNVVNMAGSFCLAVYTPLGAMGVAYGTVIAQYTGLIVALVLLWRGYGELLGFLNLRRSLVWERLRTLASLNVNLIFRSLGFMVVYVGFTVLTSKYGDGPLAVGAVMMKLFMVFSYFVDGFAYAGEALVGRFIGACDKPQTVSAVRRLFVWTLGVGGLFTLFYLFGGEGFVGLMTTDPLVIEGSRPYLFWLILMPLVSCAAFMWDGVYIGATAGREVRDCMLFAALGFVLAYAGLSHHLGIQAVYVAYFVHLVVRALYLSVRWRTVLRRSFACLLLLIGVHAYGQSDHSRVDAPDIDIEELDSMELDSAFWTEIETLMDEQLTKERKLREAVANYEDGLERKELKLHTHGVNYLLRGLLSLHSDREFRRNLTRPMPHRDADILDYGIALSPLAATWGLRAAGVESRSTMKRMLLANSMALCFTAGITEGIKGVNERRPNWEDNHSMPSGHTAIAFASATILHREYGHLSPWISVGGYAAATATQLLRVRRNEHWLTDTYIGAGIGTMATNLAYFITDLIMREDGINRAKLRKGDIIRTINFLERPSSFTLVSGVEMGSESKVNTTSMFSAGLAYSHFFNSNWGMEARGRVSTCGIDHNGETDNLDLYHLNLGAVYSLPFNATTRFSIHGFAGTRFIDNSLLKIRHEIRPQLGLGISTDVMHTPNSVMGVRFDFSHTFSDWFSNRWLLTIQYKIQL